MTDDLHRLGGRGLRTLRNQARHRLPMVMGLPGRNQKDPARQGPAVKASGRLRLQAGGHRQ